MFSKTLSLSLFFCSCRPWACLAFVDSHPVEVPQILLCARCPTAQECERPSRSYKNKPSICMIFPTKKSIIELKLDSCENLVVEGGGVVFKVCPRNKVHAVCKIHKIKCKGFLAEERVAKTGCAINFGTRPRVVQLIFFMCFFYFISIQFYFLFFAARILCLAGCSQKVVFNKGPPQATFLSIGSSPRKH